MFTLKDLLTITVLATALTAFVFVMYVFIAPAMVVWAVLFDPNGRAGDAYLNRLNAWHNAVSDKVIAWADA